MKILIISDSHGKMDNVEKVIRRENDLDMVIHLGDILEQDDKLRGLCECPVVVLKGNCDLLSENKLTEIIKLKGNKILATHGHHYGVNMGIDCICYAAQENQCNIAMYGHTHVPDISYFGGVIIVNPGSISQPRQLNRKPTYALMTINNEGKADISIKYV